jgi:hypothetical protein
LADNGITVKNDLNPALSQLNVSSVIDLASLNDEEVNTFVSAMKPGNQKKWAKKEISSKLAAYLKDAIEAAAKQLEDMVAEANSKSTVAEWLSVLSLGSGAEEWLDDQGYDEELSALKELTATEKEELIAATKATSGGSDIQVKRVTAALRILVRGVVW